MSDYTPGPWAWRKFGSELILIQDTGARKVVLAAESLDSNRAAIYTRTPAHGDFLKAITDDHPNAKLIAAAPEMYEAIVKVLTPGNGLGFRGEFELLRQAALKVKT